MEAIDYMPLQGHTLSIGEITALTCSLPVLSHQTGRPIRFWGKVYGVQGADYLIAQAQSDDFLEQPLSFYSTDGGTRWNKLETPTEQQVEFSAQIRGPFMGDPKYEYKLQKDIPPEEPAAVDPAAKAAEEAALAEKADDEEPLEEDGEGGEEGDEAGDAADAAPEEDGEGDEEKKPVKRRPKFQIITMTEASRLSYFIIEHDRACRLVPRGSVLRGSDNVIVKNRGFKGMTVEEAVQLRNYFKHVEHYDLKSNARLFEENFAASRDFLKSVADDVPNGIWALKYDDATGVVTLHNLLFLGSMFYYKSGSPSYGNVYVGTGERNLDMLFMLP
jgi:radial spoke head protein 9